MASAKRKEGGEWPWDWVLRHSIERRGVMRMVERQQHGLEEGPPHPEEVEVVDHRDNDVELVLEQRSVWDQTPPPWRRFVVPRRMLERGRLRHWLRKIEMARGDGRCAVRDTRGLPEKKVGHGSTGTLSRIWGKSSSATILEKIRRRLSLE